VIPLVLAAVALAAWTYREGVHPDLFPKRFAEVEAGVLYRAGKLTPAAFERVVKSHGIRTIVDLGAWPEGSREDRRARDTARALGVERIRLDLRGDSRGDPNHYADTLRLIRDPRRRPVLVHCGAGTERTGCAVALYRQIEQGWELERAYLEADHAGHSPTRNPELRRTLERWTAPVAEALRTGERIPWTPEH
jgi:protein tyrosine/serine phosphatase